MSIGRESDKFMLRLPDGMRDRIKAAAEANNRSMNAEIVATLEKEYPADIYTAEKFLSLLQSLAQPMRLEDAIDKRDAINATLQHLGIDLEVIAVHGRDIVMERKERSS